MSHPTPHTAVAVERALASLRTVDPTPFAQGLSPQGATWGWEAALDGAANFRQDLPTQFPESVAIISARGVFTAPLEWVTLYAAGGSQIVLKAPQDATGACTAIVAAFAAERLPVEVTTSRKLPPTDVTLGFGSDATAAQLTHERTGHVRTFGHRFAALWLPAPPTPTSARAAMDDVALFDTRGCFAPAVAITPHPDAWIDALATEAVRAQAEHPRGSVDPRLGPEWRRRVGLARITGRAEVGENWALARLPPQHVVPTTLPRFLTVIEGSNLGALEPWRHHFGSLATIGPPPADHGFARVVNVGQLQRPQLPRLHDGQPMVDQGDKKA